MEKKDYYNSDDFCELCADERKKRGLVPNLLVLLPTVTMLRGYHVFLCPDCDGAAVDLALR